MADKPKKPKAPAKAKAETLPAVQVVIGPAEAPNLGGPGGENEHVPTELAKQAVKYMVASGCTQEQVALSLRIDEKTLRKHYREELDTGMADVAKLVTGKLYKKILEEETAAVLFFCKTRLNMKEQIDLSGKLHLTATDTSDVPDERVKMLGEKMLTDGL